MKRVTFGNILESGKISIEEFKSKYWGKKPLLIKGAVKQPGLAFSKEQFIAEFENPASKWKWHPMPSDLPTNEEIFKLSENEDVFERANITDSQVRLKLLKEKYYFYCQPDKEIPKSMCSFISSIQNTLNSPTENYTTTLFYSVNGVGHTDEHSDGYENFVLQLYGSKKWILGTEQSDFKLTVMEKNEKRILLYRFSTV